MNTHSESAKAILNALVDRDLIAVRANDAAIDLLARAISEADRATVVDEVLRSLEGSDLIDEIYASDSELRRVIAGALPPLEEVDRPNGDLTGVVRPGYWVQMSDGLAHETWAGPFATAADAEARGWEFDEGITVTLFRRAPGKPDEFIKRLGSDGTAEDQ